MELVRLVALELLDPVASLHFTVAKGALVWVTRLHLRVNRATERVTDLLDGGFRASHRLRGWLWPASDGLGANEVKSTIVLKFIPSDRRILKVV